MKKSQLIELNAMLDSALETHEFDLAGEVGKKLLRDHNPARLLKPFQKGAARVGQGISQGASRVGQGIAKNPMASVGTAAVLGTGLGAGVALSPRAQQRKKEEEMRKANQATMQKAFAILNDDLIEFKYDDTLHASDPRYERKQRRDWQREQAASGKAGSLSPTVIADQEAARKAAYSPEKRWSRAKGSVSRGARSVQRMHRGLSGAQKLAIYGGGSLLAAGGIGGGIAVPVAVSSKKKDDKPQKPKRRRHNERKMQQG